MNGKKASALFLTIILFHFGVVLGLWLFPLSIMANMLMNLFVSQMIIVLPAICFLGITRTNPVRLCRMRKLHISSLLMTVLFTFLCSPIMTLANVISMLFVENTVLGMSTHILQMPFLPMLLMMAVFGPFMEEFVFRGVIYQGFQSDGNVFWAMVLSALLFALMHLNFNQASYAFVIGIILVLLMEATDSLWSVFLFHFLINATNVGTMFLMKRMPAELLEKSIEQAAQFSNTEMLLSVSVYLLLAVVATPLAGCVLVWIARREGRLERVKYIWESRRNAKKGYFNIFLIISVVFCLIYMVWEVMIG